jgi:hypothetical protein
MVARTSPLHGLAVAFHRGGEEIDREVVETGELAVLAGTAILLRRKALQDGDKLTVAETR